MKPTPDTLKRALRIASHFVALQQDADYQAAHSLYEKTCHELASLPVDAASDLTEKLCRDLTASFNKKQAVSRRYSALLMETGLVSN
jgi:hypothetical protein